MPTATTAQLDAALTDVLRDGTVAPVPLFKTARATLRAQGISVSDTLLELRLWQLVGRGVIHWRREGGMQLTAHR